MSSWIWNGFAVLTALCGVGVLVIVQIRERKRTSMVSSFADGLGATFKPVDGDLEPRQPPLQQFELGVVDGMRGSFRNIVCIDMGSGQQLWIADHYLAHPLRVALWPKRKVQTVGLISMGQTRLPKMLVRPRDESPKCKISEPWKEVAIPSDANFCESFEVLSVQGADAAMALHDKARGTIRGRENMWIETSGPWVVVFRKQIRCREHELHVFLQEAQTVRNALLDPDAQAQGRTDHAVDLSSTVRQVA